MRRKGEEHRVLDAHFGLWQREGRLLPFILSIFLGFSLAACDRNPASNAAGVKATSPPQQDLRAEWVVLIDNSKSITPPEQLLIREATMLLADLADPGDRVSVITFGSQARQEASVPIQNDQDRRRFQDLVRANVDFKENFSDLRIGLRLLAAQRQSLFPTETARHAAMLLSDGLLEPADRQPVPALQELKETVRGPLQNLDIFAIALGMTASQKAIPGLATPLTGQQLMEQEIARPPGNSTHAKQLDQVLDATLRILKSVKGLSSSNDGGATYRIDKTVETMTLIVRKRSVDGKVLAESKDIQLEPPQPEGTQSGIQATQKSAETIYRNGDYQYFDLFVVRNPRPGEWRVTLSNGQTPQVLSKIDTPIQLNAKAKPAYYLNESGVLWAWLFDAKQQAASHADYQLKAHVLNAGDKAETSYLPFSLDAASGQYFLAMPEAVKPSLASNQAATVELEIKATQAGDPMFLRQTTVKTDLAQPLIEWKQTPGWLERVPFTASTLEFGGSVDARHPHYRAFDVPPGLKITLEVFDQDSQQYQPSSTDTATPQSTGGKLDYAIAKPFADYRQYRYRYELTGNTAQGERSITSPWYSLEHRFPWTLAGLVAGALLLLIHILGHFTAKLRGRIQVNCNGHYELLTITPRKMFRSSGEPACSACDVQFAITAKRLFWFYKYLLLEPKGSGARVDKIPLAAGKAVKLSPNRRHSLTFGQSSIDFTLYIV